MDFLGGTVIKNLRASAGDVGSIPGGENIPWGRAWQPTPRFLPGESYGYRSLAGYSPWGCKELNTIEITQRNLKYCHFNLN